MEIRVFEPAICNELLAFVLHPLDELLLVDLVQVEHEEDRLAIWAMVHGRRAGRDVLLGSESKGVLCASLGNRLFFKAVQTGIILSLVGRDELTFQNAGAQTASDDATVLTFKL